MPLTEAERIQLGRDCTEFAGFRRKVVWQGDALTVERLAGKVEKPFTTYADLAPNTGFLALTESGAILARSETSSHWRLAPPSGVAVSRGPRRVLLRLAKGTHAATVVTWSMASHLALAETFDRLFATHVRVDNGLGLPTRTMKPHFEHAYERFRRAFTLGSDLLIGTMIWSVVSEAVAFVADPSSDSNLAPTPGDLPLNLRNLVDSVRKDPRRPWPLKDAADLAEYSPFHFSRVFKQLVGFGFHEFVDRVRCELGVELLCDTEDPIDLIATMAGFTTTQGLRDALKEYVGMSPKDFRSDPHHSLIR